MLKKIILISAFIAAASHTFAMAGFAERWLESWINDLFFASTVAVVQIILLCLAFAAKNRLKHIPYLKFCNMMAANEPAAIAIGGLLLSFVISTYIGFVCGIFFIFGIFLFLSILVLDWLCVFISSWRKKIINAKFILCLCILSTGALIGYALYICVVRYNWLTSLYSYSYYDSSMPDVDFIVHPTRYPSITQIFTYTSILYLPWMICAVIKTLKYLRFRRCIEKRHLDK